MASKNEVRGMFTCSCPEHTVGCKQTAFGENELRPCPVGNKANWRPAAPKVLAK